MDIVTKNKINILIQLAEVDKHFATEEREMIYTIAREHNFPDEQVAALIRSPQPIVSLGALSTEQKVDYLISSIELIFVDRKVHESEVKLSKSIAIKLGFNKNVVDYLVENFGKRSPEELKKTVLDEFGLL